MVSRGEARTSHAELFGWPPQDDWRLERKSVAEEGDDMERRVLGGTGISVSEFALGTMMLGAQGNVDHDESISMIHRASTGESISWTTPTCTPEASLRKSWEKPWPVGARQGGSGDQVRAPGGGRSQQTGCLAALDRPAPLRPTSASAPTTSTSTSNTDPITARISTRHLVLCPT